MILIDANLLIYAHIATMPQHQRAHVWLDETINQSPRVGLPWPSLLAFLRITTNPRIFERPLTPSLAWKQVKAWLDAPSVWIPHPTEQHPRLLGDLLEHSNASSNLVPDAHLAALALEHGLTLCSSDGDFARFPKLTWVNPLTDSR